MSIPLDRLYHYIDSVAQEITSDNVVIYRFFPHGSKKLQDLTNLKKPKNLTDFLSKIELVCHDQEPLNYDFYVDHLRFGPYFKQENQYLLTDIDLELHKTNLRDSPHNIYDKCLLLHSELNSKEVEKYAQDQFVPVYYWSHAIIAQDWYRYAQHITQTKTNNTQKFLVYNRAWTGTREYRLKLADLLIDNQLVDHCRTSCAFTDHDSQTHYSQHKFANPQWRPTYKLEQYYKNNEHSAQLSADFELEDYECTDIEIVLETLFDDSRIHLTEKTLRPIALAQPFLLLGPAGSLNYLKSYGFKTFGDLIDESYDDITDPKQRLVAVIKVMNLLKNLPSTEYQQTLNAMKNVAQFNKNHFFSGSFTQQVKKELHNNLSQGVTQLLSTNTYHRYLSFRNTMRQNTKFVEWKKNNVPADKIEMFDQIYHKLLNNSHQ